jgi:hypothetical protein
MPSTSSMGPSILEAPCTFHRIFDRNVIKDGASVAFKALPVADPVAGAVVDSISLGARLAWALLSIEAILVVARRSPIEKRRLA